MNDLAYWASMLVWPAGVAVLALVVLREGRRDERRWRAEAVAADRAGLTLDELDRRLRALEAAPRAAARQEAAE